MTLLEQLMQALEAAIMKNIANQQDKNFTKEQMYAFIRADVENTLAQMGGIEGIKIEHFEALINKCVESYYG